MRLYLKDLKQLLPFILGFGLLAVFGPAIRSYLYWLTPIVTGVYVFGKEYESKTIIFAESLPVTKSSIWAAKFGAILTCNAFMFLLYLFDSNNFRSFQAVVIFPVFIFPAAFTLLFSIITKNIFIAGGLSFLSVVVTSGMMIQMRKLLRINIFITNPGIEGSRYYAQLLTIEFLIMITLALLLFYISSKIYTGKRR